MDENQEQVYIRGQRSAWQQLYRLALQNLGYDDPEAQGAAWAIEREQVINALRSLCDDFGDNNWDTSLNLADVIEKHLGRYLYEAAE